MKLLEFFLKRPIIANLITLALIVFGVFTALNLNRTSYPHVDFDVMLITTTYPGASALDIETNVTKPIEDELKTVDDIDHVISSSLENISMIYVFVDHDSGKKEQVKDDIFRAVDRVSDLPDGVDGRPNIKEMSTDNITTLEIGIYGIPEPQLRKVADDLSEAIEDIQGVSSVEKVGYRKQEVKIQLDSSKLQENYISIGEVIQIIKKRNVRSSGGNLESIDKEQKFVTFAEFDQPLDVADVIIRSNFSGKQVRLDQIAQITQGYEKPKILAKTNLKNSINLLVKVRANADTISISENIRKLIKETQAIPNDAIVQLQSQNLYKHFSWLLPKTIKLEQLSQTYKDSFALPQNTQVALVSDFSRYTASLLSIVQSNALIGFILVLGMLFIFLSRYTAFWTAIGIPVAILGALCAFPILDLQINMITLMTFIVVLGLIVDDAIVIAENISRHREMGKSPMDASLIGVKEMFKPVLTTIMTTILAFVPMYAMSGVTGEFVKSIPTVVIIALILSLFEACLLMPVHIAHSKTLSPKPLKWFEKMKDIYAKTLLFFVRFRLVTLLIFASFLGLAFFVANTSLKVVLFPYQDVDVFYIKAELPSGSSIQLTQKRLEILESFVTQIPQNLMDGFTTRVGHHDTDVYGASQGLHENWGLITVFLKPAGERSITSEKIISKIKEQVLPYQYNLDAKTLNTFYKQLPNFLKSENNQKNIVALIKDFKNYRSQFTLINVEEYNDGPPVGKAINVTLVSDQDDLRKEWAQKIKAFTATKVPGSKSVEVNEKLGKEEIRLKPNYQAMARTGITAEQILQTIRAAYEGFVATTLVREGEEIDFRVQLSKNDRTQIDKVKSLEIPNPLGKLIPLEKLIYVSEPVRESESHIHYDSKRAVTVTADLDQKISTASEANELIREEFAKQIEATSGIRIVFGGEEKETQKSMASFKKAFPFALIGIFCILAILFNSYLQPFIIMTAIPFGLAGVVFTFFGNNLLYQVGITPNELPFSFLAIIGCLGLVGIVVNDSLVMVSYLNEQRKETDTLFSLGKLIEGAKTRFRPVLLTTVTTVAGLIPTILGIGGYEPFILPIVLALAGGLIFATAVTLILIPVVYSFYVKAKA